MDIVLAVIYFAGMCIFGGLKAYNIIQDIKNDNKESNDSEKSNNDIDDLF